MFNLFTWKVRRALWAVWIGLLQYPQVGSAQYQPYFFRHLTTEHGLLNNQVKCLYQDRQGYMWIATIDGLQRYDGKRFVNYLPDVRDPEALQDGYVNTMYEDSRSRLWVGSSAPLLLNRSNGKFYNYNLHLPPGASPLKGVARFLEDSERRIWTFDGQTFYRLNEGTNQFEDMGRAAGMPQPIRPQHLQMDGRGRVWMITASGFWYYDPSSGKCFERKSTGTSDRIFGLPTSNVALVFRGNDLWMAQNSTRTLYHYSLESDSLEIFDVPVVNARLTRSNDYEQKVNNLVVARDGKIACVMSGEGISILDPGTRVFTQLLFNNSDPYGMHGSPEFFAWYPFWQDRSGTFWVASDRGINLFNPYKKRFTFYGNEEREDKSLLPAYTVNAFLRERSSGDIFIACYYPTGGVLRLTPDLRLKKWYQYERNGNLSQPENQVWCLYQDRGGLIWAPTQAGNILKIDPGNDRFFLEKDTLIRGNINTIKEDGQGNIWLGTWSMGLRKFEPAGRMLATYDQSVPGSPFQPRNILCTYLDGDSLVWAGSNYNGLYCFDRRKGKYTACFILDEKDPYSISNNLILQILPYGKDTLLIATGMGLNFFDRRLKRFSHLSGKDGLPGNSVQTMAVDDNGNIWLACDGGFCRLQMPGKLITRYGLEDGITSEIFNTAAILRTDDGQFLVSGTKGFFAFRPGELSGAAAPPDPVITGIRINNRLLAVDSFGNSGRELSLNALENNIVFEFSSLVFGQPGQLRYYYRLEGVDKDWVAAGEDQLAHYNQLRHGHYVFHVKCISRDGVPSASVATLYIRIRPEFWQTWWFRLALVLLAGAVLWAIYRQAQRRRREKERLRIGYEKKIAAVQMNTLRAQMNPHFIFNSLNSINTFILKNDQENASEYLNKFSQLVRLILDNSRSEWVSLENELKALELYIELEALRFDNSFSYDIAVSPGVAVSSVLIPPLLIQPYVENAIRHGLVHRKDRNGLLQVMVARQSDRLEIQVQDNGIGRKESERLRNAQRHLHTSHGMQITAERIAIIRETYKVEASVEVDDLHLDDGQSAGTRVTLTIQYRTHAGHHH